MEVGVLDVGGTLIDAGTVDAYRDLEALGFFVDDATYDSYLNESAFAGAESAITVSDYASLLPLLNSGANGTYPSDLSSAEALQVPPPFAREAFGIYSLDIDAMGAGMHAVLVVHDGGAGNVQNLSAGNYFGVVATSYTTDALGSSVVSFLGAGERWTDLLVGDGSTKLVRKRSSWPRS